ncbi:lymphocyte antigen 75-like [Osmerus eperlanus]|uniref:lymphocyte antigen 75-like n=1 Tax=Osmerus eperlanus TaxID=29151 RepID=UPI002E1351EC
MEKSVLRMLLVFSGLSILPSCLSFHYEYVNENKTWTEAQRICREKYTDLATFDDPATKPLKGLSHVRAWIGLSHGSWMWSLDDTMLNDSYTNFKNYVSKSAELDENKTCVKMSPRVWDKISCSANIPFVCYDRNVTSNYICIGENKTWDESRSYCRANHTDLASVRNKTEENATVHARDNEPCSNEYWIGLSRVKWQWSDQSVFHIQNWEDKEPNGGDTEKCVEMSGKTGQWNDEACDKTKPFICYDDDLVLGA